MTAPRRRAPETVDLPTIADTHRQHEADAHLRGRDEPGLPERALDGAEGPHGLDGAVEPTVDLDQVLGQLDPGGHGDGQDIGLDVPRKTVLDVQAHAAAVSPGVGPGWVGWLVESGRSPRVYRTG